ncbi:MAG: hypothetical protein RL235_769 [Chlamydiota bacterium]|jgi:hypothetical protein
MTLLFILDKWLDCFKWAETLSTERIENDLAETLLGKLERFLLFSLENPFAKQGGFLDMFSFYSDLLIQASKVEGEHISSTLEEMRNLVLHMRAHCLKKGKVVLSVTRANLMRHFEEFLKTIKTRLKHFFAALVPFLQEARTDENVLIYLIEQKEQFNSRIGNRTIEELLRRFFPGGQPVLRAVICEGFTRRGFTSFFTEKEPLIEALEWEPCTACVATH